MLRLNNFQFSDDLCLNRGSTKLIVDPGGHSNQYPSMMRPASSARGNEGRAKHLTQTMIHVKRNQGYSEVEKRLNQRYVELCHLGRGDTFGESAV